MRSLLLPAIVFAFCISARAGLAPLTTSEISLMLRTGYSPAAVEQELTRRYFAGALDAAAEKKLAEAGATAELLKNVRTGRYAVPPEKAERLQDEAAAQSGRRTAQAEEAKKFNTLYQEQLRQTRAAAAVIEKSNEGADKIFSQLRGDLVTQTNGNLSAMLDEGVAKKKLFALYFSAQWCGPCRKFTPQLVDYYKRVAPQQPEFEIIFVSGDRSPAAMEKYMREFNMPWPALRFEKIAEKTELTKHGGNGIPCLVLLDGAGRVLSHSYVNGNYVGPAKVLEALDGIFSRGQAPPHLAKKG